MADQTLLCPEGTDPAAGDSSDPDPAQVRIESATPLRSLEGFGASIAWHQGTLVNHPRKAEIYSVIFRELGLDILRFRNRHQRSSEPVDLGEEQEIVEAATESLGHRPRLMLSSWSPPATLKANGREACSGDSDCTLRKVGEEFDYAGFASYWHDSLQEYSEQHGIVFDWVSVQNEPDYIPGWWEGCRFDPSETGQSPRYPGYDRALSAVSERLQQLASPPGLIGPETLGVHYNKAATYLAALDQKLLVAAAHHLYEQGSDGVWDWRVPGPDSYIIPLQTVPEAAPSLPIFQTEFWTDDDQGTEGGFETAWLIHNVLEREGAVAFLYWDLVWARDQVERGLVSLGPDDYQIRDQYYSLRHYSYFTDPGYLHLPSSSNSCLIRVSAFLAPDQTRLVVVILNLDRTEHSVTIESGEYPSSRSEVYRTIYREPPEVSERWSDLGSLGPDRALALPGRSVVTVVFRQ